MTTATPVAGTEWGAPRSEPGPGKAKPNPAHSRPRTAVLDPHPATVYTPAGPVLVIPAREVAALLDAAMFLAAIDQASRAAFTRAAVNPTVCPQTA